MDEVVEHAGAVGAFVYRVAGGDEVVGGGVEVYFVQEGEELVFAAVDVAYEDEASLAVRVVFAAGEESFVQVLDFDGAVLEVSSFCDADCVEFDLAVLDGVDEASAHSLVHDLRVKHPVNETEKEQDEREKDGQNGHALP